MKLYRDVLAQGWQLTITHPTGWWFGLFAALVFGVGGEIDRYLRYVNVVSLRLWQDSAWWQFGQQVVQQLTQGKVAVWLFLVLFCLSLAVVMYVTMVSVGALIFRAGKNQVSFQQAFTGGQQHVVALFFLHLSAYVFIILVTLLSMSVITDDQAALFVTVMLLMPIVIVTSMLTRYAANYIVLQGKHLPAAITAAWKLFCQHWLVTLEMTIVNFVIILALNLIVLVSTILMLAPYFATVLFIQPETFVTQLFDGAYAGSMVYVLVTIFFGAIFSTWQWSAWTRLFQKLQTERHTSTLARLLSTKRL